MTQLVNLETSNPLELFNGKRDTLQDLLNAIKSEFDGQVFDVTTPKGRKDCASAAHKVARSKTTLDSIGKEAKSQYAKITSAIDADRRFAWDTLESWQNEIRRPLDEWEAAEKARVDSIQWRMSQFNSDTDWFNSAQIADKLSALSAIEVDDTFAEFQKEAAMKKANVIVVLSAKHTLKAQEEKEAAEKEAQRLADAEAKRQQELRDAEERARKQEQEKAKRDAEELEAKHKRDMEEARQREIQAEARRISDAEKSERDRLAAIENERMRVAAENKRIADEQARREADIQHKKQINNAALAAIVAECGVDSETAKRVVAAIASGKVPAVKISY